MAPQPAASRFTAPSEGFGNSTDGGSHLDRLQGQERQGSLRSREFVHMIVCRYKSGRHSWKGLYRVGNVVSGQRNIIYCTAHVVVREVATSAFCSLGSGNFSGASRGDRWRCEVHEPTIYKSPLHIWL